MESRHSGRSGPAQRRLDVMHGLFRVVAGTQKGARKVVTYLGSEPVAIIEGESPQAALEAMCDILGDRTARQRQDRTDGVPTGPECAKVIPSLDHARRDRAIEPFLTHAVSTVGARQEWRMLS